MRALAALASLVLILLAGCGSDPTSSSRDDRPGSVLVTIESKGGGDTVDYGISVDGTERGRVVGTGFVTIGDLPAGTHVVALTDADAACRILPNASRSITVRGGLTETVRFTVDCRPTAFDRIVFESDRTGNWEIFTMNADGSDPQQVSNDPTFDFFPELAPDGAAIVWAAYRDGGSVGEIFVANVDGSDVRNLTNHPANDYLPAWSPDGQSIAFVSNRDGSNDIWTVNLDSGALRQITNVSSADLEPDWTPDGKSLVFSSFRSGDGQHVFVQKIGDPDATQLTFGNLFLEEAPELSPDGSTIAYRRYNVAPEGIYLLNIDGEEPVNLTTDLDANPTWSPDGTRLAYDHDGDIYVMGRDGSAPANLTQSDGNDRRPHWGPAAD